VEKLLQLDLDGVVGAGLLAQFRLTLGDGGRVVWFEDNSSVVRMLQQQSAPAPAPSAAPPVNQSAGPAPSVAPAAPPPPKKAAPPPAKKPKPKP
jgi:hypothetical protein